MPQMSVESVTGEIQDQHTNLLNISHFSFRVPCGANNCQVKLPPPATPCKQECDVLCLHHYIIENSVFGQILFQLHTLKLDCVDSNCDQYSIFGEKELFS